MTFPQKAGGGLPGEHASFPPQPPFATGLKGRCPRCGDGRLFDGFLSVSPRCGACGLEFSFADTADAPVVFVILFVGFAVAAAALIVELAYVPPIWVHIVLWGPLVVLLSLGLLRPLKGVLIALQYVNKAEEGRIEQSQ